MVPLYAQYPCLDPAPLICPTGPLLMIDSAWWLPANIQHSHTCPAGIAWPFCPPNTPAQTQGLLLISSPSLKFASKHTRTSCTHSVWGRHRCLVHTQPPAPGTWTVTHGPTLPATSEPCTCLIHPSPPVAGFQYTHHSRPSGWK